jgi:hypothetical protein
LGQTDDQLRLLQNYLAQFPDAGPTIEGAGGARKIRWAREGRTGGKSGGLRVIYWDDSGSGILFLLVVFAKKEKSDLTPAEKKILKDFIGTL